MFDVSLTISQLTTPPANNWCKSGHTAKQDERFFHVSGRNLETGRWGAYCETCLTVANKLAEKKKQNT
jgi:hypothetical protein